MSFLRTAEGIQVCYPFAMHVVNDPTYAPVNAQKQGIRRVMEGGKLIFETAVDLDRPRARSGRVFIEIRVLAQVMQGR